MKKTFIPICLLLSACANIDMREPVTTGIDVTTSVTMTNITRADWPSTIKRLTYVLMNDADEIVQEGHKTSDMESLSLDCPVGTYTLILAANSGNEPTVNDGGTLTYTKVGDMFSAYKSVTVSDEARASVSSQLNRSVSMLSIVSTDNIPSDVAKIKVKVEGISDTYDVVTGSGVGTTTYEATVNAAPNTVNGKFDTFKYCILPSTSITNAKLTLTFLDSSEAEIRTVSYDNLPLTVNRNTILKAAMFHDNGADASITINSTWGEDINVNR